VVIKKYIKLLKNFFVTLFQFLIFLFPFCKKLK